MALVELKLQDIYKSVFYQAGLPVPVLMADAVNKLFRSNPISPTETQAYDTGKPALSKLKIALDNQELNFALPPILSLQGNINIIETAIAGLDGTIKEITSLQDYNINIKGFLSATGNVEVIDDTSGLRFFLKKPEFPERELRQLRAFFEAKKAVEVIESELLSFFNIKKMVFKTLSFSELEGYKGVVPFEAEAVSDKDYILIIE
ncbi:MAG: DUF6046 domain-containing protein [Thermonemataceae bacterium]|nr:DUF6046 domain-containing protein [Thermonemataceae bacterium]